MSFSMKYKLPHKPHSGTDKVSKIVQLESTKFSLNSKVSPYTEILALLI